MKLEHVGESFEDAHPVISWLGSIPVVITIAVIIIIIALIIMFIIKLYEKTEDTGKLGLMMNLKGIVFTGFWLGVLAFIAIIVSATSYLWQKSTGQSITYEGQGRVVDVAPIEENQVQDVVQDITFEHKGKKYKVSQPTKVAQDLHQGDKIKLVREIEHGVKSNPEYNDYQNKDGSFKKEIDIQNHMDELEIEKQ